jgi:dipeptidyl aminopeptidase/acylaminoacyl peptidase
MRRSLLPLLLALAFAPAAHATKGLDVRDLATLERISSPVLSPDGHKVVFAVREMNYAENKSTTGLWLEDLAARDAAPPARFTAADMNVNSPAFSPDGHTVYFLSAKSGSMQLWSQSLASGVAQQLSDYPVDVAGFKPAPDGKSIALAFEVYDECQLKSISLPSDPPQTHLQQGLQYGKRFTNLSDDDLTCTKRNLANIEADKATGQVYDRLFVRHWDTWADGRRNQLYVAALGADGKPGAPVLVSPFIDGDVISKPFGDASEFAWSPDSKSIVFGARIAGKSEPWSTNFDLFLVPADGSAMPRNLTDANDAWDAGPAFSKDGRTLYYRAMKRPGFEADRFGLMAMDLASGATREIDPGWDRSADATVLSPDGRKIYTQAQDLGQHPLFAVDIATGATTRIAADGTIDAFDVAGDTLVFARSSLSSPARLFAARLDGSAPRKVSTNNEDALARIDFGDFEQFDFKGWNDETVHAYVVKPHGYKKGRKYPVAFLIHGGPQGSFGNSWSYRWNPQTYAAQGYAVVMVDFHGSTGYGQAFTDAISRHWGDRPLEDLQKGWAAALAKYDFLDGDRACALGASYGGYMVNWIAGHWPEPWKCLVVHDGIFDARMMAYATEELWFSEWENGGPAWEATANIEKFNPINAVDKWRVPTLVVQGGKDYRIPESQGIATFTALQRRGIESRLLYFPDENHWVLKAHNSVLWHDTVNAWLKQHIGDEPVAR